MAGWDRRGHAARSPPLRLREGKRHGSVLPCYRLVWATLHRKKKKKKAEKNNKSGNTPRRISDEE